MKKKFKKKRKIFDFFLFCIFTQKVLTRKERFLFLYIHVRERERERREAVSAAAAAREVVVVLVVERNLCSLLRFFFVLCLTREFSPHFFFYS